MYVKIHKSKDRNIIAVCDEELIGKSFSEGNLVLDINERFYKGERLNPKHTLELIIRLPFLSTSYMMCQFQLGQLLQLHDDELLL